VLRKTAITVLLLSLISASGSATDLYKVVVDSELDAWELSLIGVAGVVRLSDGYLVLAEAESADRLLNSRLDVTFIAGDVQKDKLAIDKRTDRLNAEKYPLIFEQEGLRLYRVDFAELSLSREPLELVPILIENMKFDYREPRGFDKAGFTAAGDIDSIIGLIRQDSLQSYMYRLQAFFRRVTGTDSSYASASWIKSKFEEFGYDSVFFDDFPHDIYSIPTVCRNVVAVKLGSVFPGKQIVVGAHRDAVPGSPGADDDGSGTAAVLEIARVMKNIDTEVTLVFVAFDAEEQGLYGSWHYSNEAISRGDSIIVMLNMDMIAHYTNNYYAYVSHGSETYYAQMWIDLASSYVDISGFLAGTSQGSDHFPFQQNGYDVAYTHEYYFSSVYHSNRDSTTYMNFGYMTRMVKGMTAVIVQLNSDDRDQDNISNLADNCPDNYNPGQDDSDFDGVGNVCDNCPDTYNPNQYDENHDGVGDMCDGLMHIITYDPPTGYLNEPYFFQFDAIGGVEPYYWSKWLGQPPSGCVFTGGTEGTVSGFPNWPGTFYMSVVLFDSDSPPKTDTLGVSFTIKEESGPEYVCGDADGSEEVDIDDVVFLVSYIFSDGPAPDPIESGDANCTDDIDIDDVVYIVEYVFLSGPAPCDC